MEHHVELKVLGERIFLAEQVDKPFVTLLDLWLHENLLFSDSSPDVPLATFTPANQFADIGGAARFFCEAFVGKKDLPDISISIKWYQMTDGGHDRLLNDDKQEIVKREEEQIIGSYLKIEQVGLNDFGRYLCRVEMGHSQTHRLDLNAELINALPVPADNFGMLLNPYFLASVAAVITVALFFLLLRTRVWWSTHLITFSSNELEIINIKTRDIERLNTKELKLSECRRHTCTHDDRIVGSNFMWFRCWIISWVNQPFHIKLNFIWNVKPKLI